MTPTKARKLSMGRYSYWLLLAPPLLAFVVFSWWPIGRGLVVAFQRTNLLESSWVGFDNFAKVLNDPLLGVAIANTALFTAIAALFGFPLPVLLATAIAEMRRTKQLASGLAFLPVVIPPVVTILLWKVFYDPGTNGLFNTVLSWVGISPLGWLQSPTSAMASVVLTVTWATFGSATIIYLATLSSMDHQLYEAAEMDGASTGRRFWHITLPQLRGTMLILLLLQIIGSFQIFTEPFLLTGGGPNNSTLTILMLIYRYGFIYGNFGQATALSLLLALALGVISLAYLALTKRWNR